MRLTTRLLILFIAISFAFAGFFYLFVHFKQAESKIFLDYDIMQRKQTIEALLNMKKQTELSVLADYRIRDDLRQFVSSQDQYWARRNIDTMIDSYGFTFVQIYNPQKELIYSANSPYNLSKDSFRLQPEMLDSLFSAKQMDFSSRHESNLISISAATIHASQDTLSNEIFGAMLVGQTWDNQFFLELARSLNYNINISNIEPPVVDKALSQYNIRIVHKILDWQSKPVMWLTFYMVNPSLNQIQNLGRQVIFVTGAFIFLFLMIQFILIEQWISIPISIISRSLRENRLDLLYRFNDKKSEFADVAILIEQFFHQRQNLIQEIEERERTQTKLREVEEQTLTIFLTSPESIIVTDLNGLVITANAETYRLLNLSDPPTDSPRFSILDFIHPDYLESFEEHIRSLLQGSEVRNQELEVLREDEESFPALISASVIYNAKQQPSRLIFITRDLSEMKALELKLLQSQKMESLGTLAGGIAHDFNNIMTIIAGYIAISAAKIDDHPDAQDDLDEALKACLRAKNLIAKILTFSRNTEKRIQSVILADVLTESMPMIRASIPSIISIETDIASHKRCKADPTEIQQVLLNLSSNAFYAMRKTGGKLTFSIREVTGLELIGLDPAVNIESEYLQLSVSDTGTGIAHDIMVRIFDPYFSTKTTGEGTGLGLSIVHGIVKNSGGFINVHSVVEEGTDFCIYFPIIESQETPRPVKVQKEYPFIPARILFVDDEPALAELFGEALSSAGYEIRVFSDSLQAYQEFRENQQLYDLIVADVTMPILDGIKLASRIREFSKIPIILYTGFSIYNLSEEIDHINVNRLLSKPILPTNMTQVVREVIAESKTV